MVVRGARAGTPGGQASSELPRRAELLAAISLAIDLGLGQPMEHMLRSCVLGMRIADRLGLGQARREVVFYATLLSWIGCHADSHELADVFGDDIGLRAGTYAIDKRGLPLARFMLGHVGRDEPLLGRGLQRAAFLATGRARVNRVIRSHCVSAGALARQVGIEDPVADVLGFAFERWDGAGLPEGCRRDEIPLEMRIVHLCDTAEVFLRERGRDAAVQMVRSRRGSQFAPDLADLFCAAAPELTDGLLEGDAWSLALERAPQDRVHDDAELDSVLTAMGDFADLKSPHTTGHSRGVAALAESAAVGLGLDVAEQVELRRAGLVHDLGRMGVSNSVWDKSSALTTAELERVRLHPYLTERILRRVPALAGLAATAGAHHERLDGSGYSRGATAEGLPVGARILAAADSYRTATETRPHRAARTPDEAADRLRDDVRRLRLDGSAVEAVLAAAGHRRRRRQVLPAGLTGREVDVLRLLVRGLSSKEIAAELVISEKTARNHLEHIYTKLGVSNRVSAGLFALQHGIVGGLHD